ncbi:MAG: PA0069 family radical SAM protein [Hydrogenophaga sp.]|jgi:DNA repair photolyase|uniref:PA0069 family radical SAM protein n=1 Tax=Hydrogenophaga sp. TaxID=1904254 RepID=UPI00262CD0CA|nr:PA0069 family radical SAM protein [Hydrogenophaga sp.]MDD3784616.1 PA0069 family radical SAM protein [Hydrogenophaga sp.]MDX9968609.1 PA0069 family radical SAM protein [Hydrogenophaga sp.]
MGEYRIPVQSLKGRGLAWRQPHRFERDARDAFDDGWGSPELAMHSAAEAPPPATELRWEDARSAITRNDSPDVGFVQGLNPYRGCEHGCIYCYARPTHSYLNLSPGIDFETRLVAKRGIAQVLRQELLAPRYQPAMIAIGTVTDAYQPVERELRLTREVLEVLSTCHHPLAIVTKGSGVERDLDLLAPMGAQRLAAVYVTITTLEPKLARILEPRAAAPHRRLRTIRTLAEAGVPVGVSVAPQIPFINDDMEQVLEAAAEAGARRAFYQVLRLPWELAPMFRTWLDQHYPDRAERVMARMRDLRGGKDYDADFATRMKGQGVWADLLRQRFHKACARYGLNREHEGIDASRFRPAALQGQSELF